MGRICEKRYNIIKTIARPTDKLTLYIAAKNMKAIKIKTPKVVSNKLTNKLGTANITTHKTINNVSKPTTKFKFLRENTSENEKAICYII